MNNIDFSKNPYRGIFIEIADDQGVTRQAVSAALRRKSTKYLRLVKEKIKERENLITTIDCKKKGLQEIT